MVTYGLISADKSKKIRFSRQFYHVIYQTLSHFDNRNCTAEATRLSVTNNILIIIAKRGKELLGDLECDFLIRM